MLTLYQTDIVISDKFSIRTGYFIGTMLFMLGIMVLPIGLAGFLSTGFTYIGIVLLALAVSGGLLLYSGVQQIRDARRKSRDAKALNTVANGENAPNADREQYNESVLAQWTCDEETWSLFHKNEIQYRNSDNLYYFAAFVGLGTIALLIFRAANLFIAVAISTIMGGIVVLMRRTLSLKKLRAAQPGQERNVVIAKGFVMLNGHLFDLYAENRNTRKVQFLKDVSPAILEFTIEWKTRNGITFDELRVPVPPEQYESVENLLIHFNNNTI